MKKILSIFGTRPEAVKMAPVVLKLREFPKDFKSVVVVTAQHRQMLDQVLALFKLKSDHDLNIMRDRQTLTQVTTRALEGLAPILQAEKPDLVLVHGDTTTTLAATLSAYYHRVPVGHVEAGLRSHDKWNPFPEEINRVLSDAMCTLHFAPTVASRNNLLRENVPDRHIYVTGNTGIDALHIAVQRVEKGEFLQPPKHLVEIARHRFILVTAHRRENFGQPIRNICGALLSIAKTRKDLHLVYPVHPNPNIHGVAHSMLGAQSNVHLLPPLEYGDFLYLVQRALFCVTDSGGLQEEAPSIGKPVLVLREVTERPEAVHAGTAKVIGTDKRRVFSAIERLLKDHKAFERMANAVNPYGDGKAAERTVQAIRHYFGIRKDRPRPFNGGGGKRKR